MRSILFNVERLLFRLPFFTRFPVEHNGVWKNKPVYLRKMLPVEAQFGNKRPIPEAAKGYVVSNGFEAGRLKVLFDLYTGKECVEFNELSARNYLESDMMLQNPRR